MNLANPRWGAPWIHGELLKIGIELSQARSRSIWSAAASIPRKPGTPFSRCPNDCLPTLVCLPDSPPRSQTSDSFRRHSHTTAEWTARQLLEALPWDRQCTTVSTPRPRRDIRPEVLRDSQMAGHSRGSYCAAQPLAKRLPREVDPFGANAWTTSWSTYGRFVPALLAAGWFFPVSETLSPEPLREKQPGTTIWPSAFFPLSDRSELGE